MVIIRAVLATTYTKASISGFVNNKVSTFASVLHVRRKVHAQKPRSSSYLGITIGMVAIAVTAFPCTCRTTGIARTRVRFTR